MKNSVLNAKNPVVLPKAIPVTLIRPTIKKFGTEKIELILERTLWKR